MKFLFTVLAFFSGVLLPIQVVINSELARHIHSSVLAALISFLVGSIYLLFSAAALKISIPTWGNLIALPSWLWTGGMIGALAVLASILVGPKIGVLAFVSLLLAGQLFASVIIDHFGWLGFPVHKMDFQRLMGIILLVSGSLLIRKS